MPQITNEKRTFIKSQLFQLYFATICVTVVCKSIQILYTSGANSTNSNNQEGSNV